MFDLKKDPLLKLNKFHELYYVLYIYIYIVKVKVYKCMCVYVHVLASIMKLKNT